VGGNAGGDAGSDAGSNRDRPCSSLGSVVARLIDALSRLLQEAKVTLLERTTFFATRSYII
jgi:hypothetical protein